MDFSLINLYWNTIENLVGDWKIKYYYAVLFYTRAGMCSSTNIYFGCPYC